MSAYFIFVHIVGDIFKYRHLVYSAGSSL